jgi:hypothetical protein
VFINVSDKILNLQNVSNINIVKDRIIFNLNYPVNINSGNKQISDYVYWDGNSNDLKARQIVFLSNNYFKNNFIEKINDGYININCISSVKFIDDKKRVIFNLNHPVTFKDYKQESKQTSEFVYIDCQNEKQYKEYENYVRYTLGEK